VLRVLVSRRWLGALAAAAVFATAAFFLGRWQWHRYEAKAANADRIHLHYGAAPKPLTEVLGGSPVPLAEDWTRVRAQGRYAADETLLVRNRPLDGTYGYEVLVPLVLGDGSAVLVDRGWVPNASNAETAPRVPPAPGGEVSLTGWVRPGEPSLDRHLPSGQVASINVADAGRQVGQPLRQGYVVLQAEQGNPPRPTPLEKPDTGLGPHQAYAFQWWAGMVAAFALVFFGVRREYLDQAAVGPEVRHGAAGADGAGSSPGAGRQPRAPRAPRAKKVRVWDEEDE
jgi:cytochrome oxidase assembly protein ShyY1